MSSEVENTLGKAASAYLRSARHQPIAWMEWGDEAFARAQREDKPVLLDIGAVWCHWCHVMDRESYENAATAQIINAHFVAVKVDRDERPDVDTRYQAAVAAISGQGGWPLTAFLTPEGKPFFGGTYFPPEDRHGRPSFQRVLLTMAEAFQQRRDEVNESAGSVMLEIEQNESFAGMAGSPGRPLLEELIASALKQFDARNGGFGTQPKFPHSSALDLLIDAAARGADAARPVVTLTLEKMAAGGIHDHLAGGFHRYSVDEQWRVPHFEKMAYDNSELLKNYVHAYQSFGDEAFALVARDIMRWMDEWLSDRERGGFYASQDADDSLDDDGDYFTWTRAEAKAVLVPEEFAVAELYFNLRDIGDMHHNPQKNVLHRGASDEDISRRLDRACGEIQQLAMTAAQKMYAARLKRRTPYIDKTVYAGWNGMCISAYLEAARVLNMPDACAFALRSLDRILKTAWNEKDGLAHVVAYGEGLEAARIPGVLDDYAFVANAALDAWETTGEMRYFTAAQAVADAMLSRFYDAAGGGFFDTEQVADSPAPIGVLAARRKPLQDAPTPAGNPVAATVLLRLAALTGSSTYAERAQQTLETFAGVVEHLGMYAATYGLALRRAIEGAVQVCVVGDDDAARELATAAMQGYAVEKSVVRLIALADLPPALAETLPHLPKLDKSFAVVCRGNVCLPPVTEAAALGALLRIPGA